MSGSASATLKASVIDMVPIQLLTLSSGSFKKRQTALYSTCGVFTSSSYFYQSINN